MQKGISFVGLMDLGSLDALKKSSAAKTLQASTSLPEKKVEIKVKELTEDVFKSALPSNGEVITYPQPC